MAINKETTMGRRGRARRQARRSRRRQRRWGGGRRQAPQAAAPAPTPEPTVAPSALVENMAAAGPPAPPAPPANPAAAAPQTMPVAAARGLLGDTAVNTLATAGDTAESAGQEMPYNLTMSNPDTRVRMVIDKWTFYQR